MKALLHCRCGKICTFTLAAGRRVVRCCFCRTDRPIRPGGFPVPPQWKSGHPPKGCVPKKVIVLGPDDFDDVKLVKKYLDALTLRFEAVEVITTGEGTRIERDGEWHWVGTDYAALKWAELCWWPRILCRAGWWGRGAKGLAARNEFALKNLGARGYCLALVPKDLRDLDEHIKELLRAVRKQIPAGHYKEVRI